MAIWINGLWITAFIALLWRGMYKRHVLKMLAKGTWNDWCYKDAMNSLNKKRNPVHVVLTASILWTFLFLMGYSAVHGSLCK